MVVVVVVVLREIACFPVLVMRVWLRDRLSW